MDHRWGRNISTYGVGDLGATLAAPYTGLPRLILTNVRHPVTRRPLVAILPVFSPPYYTYNHTVVPDIDANFPYGVDVEPDAPV